MPRTLFIADAATPLGRACAVRLGRAGWNLVLGGSSLSGLRSVCAELPDRATLPLRCDMSDPANLVPVLAAAEDRFHALDAVLFNARPRRAGWQKALGAQVAALALSAELCAPVLSRSKGRFVIAGRRAGARTLDGAVRTVTRDAMRTIAGALSADWEGAPQSVALVEPRGVEGPKDTARRIAAVLNGAGGVTGRGQSAAGSEIAGRLLRES